ncbi:MAG TPA: cell division topological specificity factor MinE [Clostridiales bacterium]|nr:cell division topological specificity factor MinE [Clostridiales bacterium]
MALLDFFKFFGKEENKSKDIAKERLKLVLIHDRANVSPKFLDLIKGDIIKVISNYMEIDETGLDIRLSRIEQEDDNYTSALVANIPIKRMKNIGKNNG